MCDRAIVLEKGKVGFDGDVTEAIKFLHYDGDDDEPDAEEDSEDERDDALANDI
jgi:ABC-2 type transport system ATP-binding protein